MAYSAIEQRYVDLLTTAAFPDAVNEPDPVAEERSLDGVQLAMGSSGAAGKRSDLTMTDAGMGLFDMLAGALRGTTAQTLGLPGDVESLVRMLTGGEQVMPTTERMNEILPPVVPPSAPNAKMRQQTAGVANTLGEFNPLTPAVVKPVVKGAKAAGSALAPVAADVIEDGLRKSGLIMDAMDPADAKAAADAWANPREFFKKLDEIQRKEERQRIDEMMRAALDNDQIFSKAKLDIERTIGRRLSADEAERVKAFIQSGRAEKRKAK